MSQPLPAIPFQLDEEDSIYIEALLSDLIPLTLEPDTAFPYFPLSLEASDVAEILGYQCYQPSHEHTVGQTIVEQDEVLRGVVDIQGLSWKEGRRARDDYILMRRNQRTHDRLTNRAKYPQSTGHDVDYSETYYDFRFTDTTQHCSYGHFQLRNLVSMTSKNDVYYINNNAVMQWSPHRRQSRTLLANCHVPYRITAMSTRNDCLLAAGEDGEFSMLNLRTCEPPVQGSLTGGRHVEVNSIEMSTSRSGASHAYITTNDHVVRNIDLETLSLLNTFPAEWFANYATQSPDKHMVCVVGDHVDGKIFSVNSREAIATLKGHTQFSFACAWTPDGRLVATGSDDMSVMVYDTRQMTWPLMTLTNDIHSSVRSMRYSDDGRFLYFAEDGDSVKIIDASTGYRKGQSIDFIGNIAGFAVTSPDSESLIIGASGQPYSSLLEFERSTADDDEDKDDPYWS